MCSLYVLPPLCMLLKMARILKVKQMVAGRGVGISSVGVNNLRIPPPNPSLHVYTLLEGEIWKDWKIRNNWKIKFKKQISLSSNCVQVCFIDPLQTWKIPRKMLNEALISKKDKANDNIGQNSHKSGEYLGKC